jgi:hypothetical protein
MSLSFVLLLTSVDSCFFSVRFNQRKEKAANEVAHALAKATTFLTSVHLFIDISTCIQHLIINEMA